MRRFALGCLMLTLATAACDKSVVAPAIDPPPTAAVQAAEISGANPLLAGAFTFLAPLPSVSVAGAFDPSVLPYLSLSVCEVSSCEAPPQATFTSLTGPGSGTIRLESDEEQFIVNLSPAALGLPSPAEYKLRVWVADLEVGSTIIQVVSKRGGTESGTESRVVLGQSTLPVKFSVRRNALVSTSMLAADGVSAADAAAKLVTEFGSDAEEVATILAAAGYQATAVASVLNETFGLSATETALLLADIALTSGDAATGAALIDAGYSVGDVAIVLRDVFGLSADEAVPLLVDIDAAASDIAAALITTFSETVDVVASLLAANGFDADTAFDAVYRAGVDVLGDPVGFSLNAALAAMHGAGYAFDDFKGALVDGARQWTDEHLLDGLGMSGYGTGELVGFMLDVMGLTAQRVMEEAESWGVSLPDLVTAMVDAGADVEDIAAGAIASFDATAAELGEALVGAGASAFEIGAALANGFSMLPGEIATSLRSLGFDGEAVFDAVYRVGTEILEDPVDFALEVALASMRGAGFFLDDFQDALVGGARDWTQENLVDALGLSGFSIAELAEFMVGTLGFSAQRVSEIAERWGVPVSDLISALAGAGVTMQEIVTWTVAAYDLTAAEFAAAMHAAGQQLADFADAVADVYSLTEEQAVAVFRTAGYLADEVGDWLFDRVAAGGGAALDLTARILAQAGYTSGSVAEWAWEKSGRVGDSTAAALRFAGFTATQVADFFVNVAGRTAGFAFSALERAGYAAATVAAAVRSVTGASFIALGGWLSDVYGLSATATISIVADLGASLGDLIGILFDVFEVTLDQAIELLVDLGFTAGEIIAGWPGTP